MHPFFIRCACVALPLSALLPVQAAYNPAIVSADARWVVHADLNALRASALGKELVDAIEKEQTQSTDGVVGLDIPKLLATIGTLTAYGTNLTPKAESIDGALIAEGTPDLRKIAESLLLQATLAQPKMYSEVTDLPFPAYAITAPPQKNSEERLEVIIAFPPEPIVLVSKSKAQLVKARDVFAGKAASLAKTPDSPLTRLASQAAGSTLFAASVVPTEPIFPQNAPQTRMMQLANAGSIALGERGANTYAHAELVASSDVNADKLMKIVQGMVALLSLAETKDEQLAEFLRSTKVNRNGNTVALDLAYSSARLAQMAQTIRSSADSKPRQIPIVSGRTVAEWGPDASGQSVVPAGSDPLDRTIENVTLKNGDLVTLGRTPTGQKNARFTRVEITPAAGGPTLTFTSEFMRNVRGVMWQFPFPGADGAYHLKVTYLPDAEGKAKYAVSIADPKPAQTPVAPRPPGQGPEASDRKWKK